MERVKIPLLEERSGESTNWAYAMLTSPRLIRQWSHVEVPQWGFIFNGGYT